MLPYKYRQNSYFNRFFLRESIFNTISRSKNALWTSFVIGLKRVACIGQIEDMSSAQIVSVKWVAPFFACSDGDRWRERVHCGHCHPQLTMWQVLKRKACSCLADTLSADARFLSLKWTNYWQLSHEIQNSFIKCFAYSKLGMNSFHSIIFHDRVFYLINYLDKIDYNYKLILRSFYF